MKHKMIYTGLLLFTTFYLYYICMTRMYMIAFFSGRHW